MVEEEGGRLTNKSSFFGLFFFNTKKNSSEKSASHYNDQPWSDYAGGEVGDVCLLFKVKKKFKKIENQWKLSVIDRVTDLWWQAMDSNDVTGRLC